MNSTHSHFSPQEIAHFNALSNEWWDKDGRCRTLHDINPLRLQFILQHTPLAGLAVLDIGCGGGILAESLAEQGAIVTGIDAAENLIHCARSHALQNQHIIHYEHTTAEEYVKHNPTQFDVICCYELLEHVEDPISLIKTCQANKLDKQ